MRSLGFGFDPLSLGLTRPEGASAMMTATGICPNAATMPALSMCWRSNNPNQPPLLDGSRAYIKPSRVIRPTRSLSWKRIHHRGAGEVVMTWRPGAASPILPCSRTSAPSSPPPEPVVARTGTHSLAERGANLLGIHGRFSPVENGSSASRQPVVLGRSCNLAIFGAGYADSVMLYMGGARSAEFPAGRESG